MAQRDLTQGNIPSQLVELACPLIIGNILQQLYNTIDAFVIGRFAGQAEFAAIGVAGSVMNLFIFAIVGACSGISVILARLYGAKDFPAFRREHFIALLTGLGFTLAVVAASVFGMPSLLSLIRTPAEIFAHTQTYLTIVTFGLPAAFLYNLYNALLRSVGNTNAALAILAAAAGTNLLLDLLFVCVFDMGIAGAAWATTAAQVFSALLCIIYLRIKVPDLLFSREDCKTDKTMFWETIRSSSVMALRNSGLFIGKLLVQGSINTAGTAMISAYTATTRIEGFANSFGDSGAAATAIMTAQNIGGERPERVRKTFWCSLAITFSLGVICSLLMYFSADLTAAFMLGESGTAAHQNAVIYLKIVSLFYIFCFTGNTFAGHFSGSNRMLITLIGSLSQVFTRAILCWLWIGKGSLGVVAIATGIGWTWVNLFWGVLYKYFSKKT